ncbi:piggyBac transposable element-derived protein 3-like [Prorops nasuta]|uniref:piggyBac transposable element-derived protein 3-like n=1 Tax=Prorops nasuta TaxID=863751 RepID=UPI0034CE091B
MPKRKRRTNESTKFSHLNITNVLHEDSCQLLEYDNRIDVSVMPCANDSDVDSDWFSDDDLSHKEISNEIENVLSYKQIVNNYSIDQKYLEEKHKYKWTSGEKMYDEVLKNEYLLTDKQRNHILASSSTQLFEIFFSKEMKTHIIESSAENDLHLSMSEFDTFLGIIILTIFNKRPEISDYWSTNPLLECSVVKSAMSRNRFQEIKGKIAYSKKSEQNQDDCVWRVRTIFQIFRKNLKHFGFFQTAIAVDEMMVKFFGRLAIKQFIRNKPVRFGIKMWALCGADGFLFDCDIYGGKNATIVGKLKKCALGSRVVLGVLEKLFITTVRQKLKMYHLYCDNFFTSSDLFVHLQSLGLRATGVVRKDRVKEKNDLDKKAPRGTFAVKHDRTSGMNLITLMDSKEVSMLSTAAGVGSESSVKRYSKELKKKVEIKMPLAFTTYNKYMGGVDIHDQYCSKASPSMKSKKWTFSVFLRMIESSIANAIILSNAVRPEKTKKSTVKDFAIEITQNYLSNSKLKNHNYYKTNKYKNCLYNCGKRSFFYCNECNQYICQTCWNESHAA